MLDLINAVLYSVSLCAAVPEVTEDLNREWAGTCVEVAYRAELRDLDVPITLAIAWHESRFNRYAIGSRGEQGPLQAMPRWRRDAEEDVIDMGLNAVEHYTTRFEEMDDALCWYRGGGGAPCASADRRINWANRLVAAAEG